MTMRTSRSYSAVVSGRSAAIRRTTSVPTPRSRSRVRSRAVQESELAQEKAVRLKHKIDALKQQMQRFRELEQQVLALPTSRSR
jgi:hypothetical protein